jgi:hypothetical protein
LEGLPALIQPCPNFQSAGAGEFNGVGWRGHFISPNDDTKSYRRVDDPANAIGTLIIQDASKLGG